MVQKRTRMKNKPNTRSISGRADLLRVIADAPKGSLNYAAKILGYKKNKPAQTLQKVNSPQKRINNRSYETEFQAEATKEEVYQSIPFWLLTERKYLSENTPSSSDDTLPDTSLWTGLADLPPQRQLLCEWSEIMPRLRKVLSKQNNSRNPDIKPLVRKLSKAEPLKALPRKKHRQWPQKLCVLEDFATRLTPLWHDQREVSSQLARLLPHGGLHITRLEDGLKNGTIFGDIPDPQTQTLFGYSILVLSDLGVLGARPDMELAHWKRFAQECNAGGQNCVALTPAPLSYYPADFRKLWTLIEWDMANTEKLNKKMRRVQEDRLLGVLSHHVKIAPGLLRSVRRLFPEMSAVTEIDAWRSTHIASPHPVAATLSNRSKFQLRVHFRRLSVNQRREVLKVIKSWCGGDYNSVYFEAILSLGELASDIVDPSDIEGAVQFLKDIDAIAKYNPPSERLLNTGRSKVGRYFQEMRGRIGDTPMEISGAREAFDSLVNMFPRYEGGDDLPIGADPAIHSRSGPLRQLALRQQGGRVYAATQKYYDQEVEEVPSDSKPESEKHGSLLAFIDTTCEDLLIWKAPFWKKGHAPSWATRWGHDTYGPWAELTVNNSTGQQIVQSLRWISPGSFTMGSPKDEEGRFDNEGPQHKVTLTKGYWLFDTPVTQALWEAVMGNNPSYFKSPERPVESVSYDDAQDFLNKINNRFEDLDLSLPTEAQWEYACRAGSELATYAGAMEIKGEHNAPVLDEIAWYGGNSGVDFDLEEGWDSSDWSEKQYNHKKAGTRGVGLKQANSWGLYDMLGNVLEWCHDDRRNYTDTAETDPIGSLESHLWALRGGSWGIDARDVRSATRNRLTRDGRYNSVGFRCARVRGGAEPIGLGRGEAERTTATEPIGGAEKFETGEDTGEKSAKIPASPFVIRSDCEILEFSQITKPDWAEAIGRDPYGVWTDIAIGDVKQRLRWIGPGKFEMGSPEDEQGREGKDSKYNEGPQHKVTLTKGYWLFDTPVTQALWESVMGDNPSQFKSPLRPVETISWDEVQGFLKKINTISGFDLTLPTEAQWEYACRAGSELATYAGAMEIKGKSNAPVLDEIAWYGGNSGVDFDLDDGVDSSDWPEKQYDHKKAGTRIVGLKQANSWGLYDMLGNVWEWCRDDMRDYKDSAETDPIGPLESKQRALRGGSCSNYARYVRSATRNQSDRDFRSNSFGFRCARVRE